MQTIQSPVSTGNLDGGFAIKNCPRGWGNKHLIPWSAPPLLGRGGVGHTIDRCITLNPGCQQVAVACSAATCKSMQRSITSNLSGNKVRDTSRSFNQGKRWTLVLPLDYTWHLSYVISPTHLTPPVVRPLDSKRLCFTGCTIACNSIDSLQLYWFLEAKRTVQ